MRSLTNIERYLVNSDLIPFEQYFQSSGMVDERFKNKYNGLSVCVESKKVLKGANGIAKGSNSGSTVILSDSIMNDNNMRSQCLYHEVGHILLGLNTSSKETQKKLINLINYKVNYPNELLDNEVLYADGLRLLEEYLVEKFAIEMKQKAKGMPKPKKLECICHGVSGNYTYMATFDSKYGIFESLCDKLVDKTFGSFSNAVKAGFSEKYFTEFFDKYAYVEIMKILGNLGKIKKAIYTFAVHDNVPYNPNDIERILRSTNDMIDSIQIKQKNGISPATISDLTERTLRENPGQLSKFMGRVKSFFSRISSRNDIYR